MVNVGWVQGASMWCGSVWMLINEDALCMCVFSICMFIYMHLCANVSYSERRSNSKLISVFYVCVYLLFIFFISMHPGANIMIQLQNMSRYHPA